MKAWLDTETYSETPLANGTHAYAEQAEIMLFTYARDNDHAQCWDLTVNPEPPGDLLRLIETADEYWWQNGGMFDRTILKWALPDIHQMMPDHKWRDTMVQALCHGLPGSLDALSDIFKLGADLAKHKRGKQLIQMFCKPQPKNTKLRRKTRLTHPVEWAEFVEYAKSDITAMRALHDKIPKWNYPNNEFELSLWHLDQKINQRGAYADTELAEKAIEAVDLAQAGLADEVTQQTSGVVTAATQRDKLLGHILSAHGVTLPDMRADTLERRLADPDLPDAVRDLIYIRLQASTSSTSKYRKLIKGVSSDGYIRGLLQFSGAARTQRWAGRLLQPQNFLRPTLPQADIDFGIEAVKAGCAHLITDNVMELTANMMRGIIIAPPGKKLVVADLANIEGRVVAWLASEEWKLQAFRDYDTILGYDEKNKPIRKGPDLYVKAYAEAFRVSQSEVVYHTRQIGKVMELMLGYAGGVGAFLTGAATYRIDLDELTETARDTIPGRIWREAENFWNWSIETKRSTYGLERDTFIVCDSLKRMWRETNAEIVVLWKRFEEAATEAILNTGRLVPCGRVSFRRDGNWLRMMLPSGDCLAYPSPRVIDGAISYMGVNQYSRKWSRIKTYGGKFLENAAQKLARNTMAHNMPRIEAAGYETCLTVHDELITYAPDNDAFSAAGLSALLAHQLKWAPDLPLAAAGFEGYRYRKE